MDMDCRDYAYHWVSFYWFVSGIFGEQTDLRTDATWDHDGTPMCNASLLLDCLRPTP